MCAVPYRGVAPAGRPTQPGPLAAPWTQARKALVVVAIYHLSAQVIGRSSGRSAVASAAYRSGDRLTNERDGVTHDYERRRGVEHSEIMAPADAPDWAHDRSRLWNTVEATEKRKDAQLAREIEFSLPRELSADQRRELVQEFVGREFVSRGMVADVAIHSPLAADGAEQPHVHVMLTMRELRPDGFGAKVREWNDKAVLEQWRESWATTQNLALERAGIEQRVDHRSLADQGLDREPTLHLGSAAHELEQRGQPTEIGDHNRGVVERNSLREQLREAARIIRERIGQVVEAVQSLAQGDIHGMLRQIREYTKEAGGRHKGDMPLEAHRMAAERPLDDRVPGRGVRAGDRLGHRRRWLPGFTQRRWPTARQDYRSTA